MGSRMVAAAYSALGQSGKAERCQACGTFLVFNECPVDGQKRLQKANFCRERLCPMCAWRRSLKWAAEVAQVLHQAVARTPKNGWVMVTLTQRNVPSDQLPEEIDHILAGWTKLTKRQEFGAVAGWLRTLEITHNDQTDTWHPHIHALLWVTPEYWTGRGYVSQKRWRALWAAVMGIDYDPSVEVHKVKARQNGDALAAAAREVGKYTVKDSDLFGEGTDVTERVATLDQALKGRRLITWGGTLRQIAKELAPTVAEGEEDLVRITEEDHGAECSVCGTEMLLHTYRWMQSIRQYVG